MIERFGDLKLLFMLKAMLCLAFFRFLLNVLVLNGSLLTSLPKEQAATAKTRVAALFDIFSRSKTAANAWFEKGDSIFELTPLKCSIGVKSNSLVEIVLF